MHLCKGHLSTIKEVQNIAVSKSKVPDSVSAIVIATLIAKNTCRLKV